MSEKHDQYQKVRLDPEVVEEAHRRIGRMAYRPSFTNFINTTLKLAFGLTSKPQETQLPPGDKHDCYGNIK